MVGGIKGIQYIFSRFIQLPKAPLPIKVTLEKM